MTDENREDEIESSVDQVDKRHNTTLDKSPIKEVYDREKTKGINGKDISDRFLSLINVDMEEFEELSSNYPNMEKLKIGDDNTWASAILLGLDTLLKGNALSEAVNREDSDWQQKVDNNGERLGPRKASKTKSSEDSVISGDRAIAKLKERMGTGSVLQIPLWHSGIWVTIKSPSEGDLLDLERRISNAKIELGRATSGMIFSNTSIYTVSYIVNFILNQVHDASISDVSVENLKNKIKITDIPTLMWGILCSMYPSGYEYARPCTADPSNCQHVVKGMLDLPKLFWIDNTALTKYQKQHMARRGEKINNGDLERYEKEHTRGGDYIFDLADEDGDIGDIRVKLRVPNINQYETSGFKWVDKINEEVEGSLNLTNKERENYILDKARVSTLRQYGHWVKEIIIEGEVIEDLPTIEDALEELCGKEEVQDNFFTKVGDYIDDSTISTIAIPKYKCPACGGEQEADIHNFKHPHLLPIDVTTTFFTLLGQRVYKTLTSRRL